MPDRNDPPPSGKTSVPRRRRVHGVIVIVLGVLAGASPLSAQQLLVPHVSTLGGGGEPADKPPPAAAPVPGKSGAEPSNRSIIEGAWAATDPGVAACAETELHSRIPDLIARGVMPSDPRAAAAINRCRQLVAAPPPAAAPPAPEGSREAELLFWESIKSSSNPADYAEYLRQYPDGRFAGLARNRLAAGPGPALPAGKRVALVIGNADYRMLGQLGNTARDARLIAATLTSLGFELVGGGALIDLDRARFVEAVAGFGDKLAGAEVGVFYYAGHGVQIRGENFLLPVDANPSKPSDADIQLVSAQTILHQMEDSGARLKVVLLDACRNNPLGTANFRDISGGLAQMRAPEGTLISYATQPGNMARDGEPGGDSPYTIALAQAMRMKGVDVLRMLNNVGVIVDSMTGHGQQPWIEHSPIQGDFYFAGR